MVIKLTILVVLSLNAIVNATRVTFTKMGDKIYVETDPQHYAIFGQYQDEHGNMIVAVNDEHQYKLGTTCEKKWQNIKDLNGEELDNYKEIREKFLAEKRKSPILSKTSTDSYTWSDTFSTEDRNFSVMRLDGSTVVYSSRYFPSKLARIIISGEIIISIRFDRSVVMKSMHCSTEKEKLLYETIKRV